MKLISERVKKLLNKEAPGATLKNYRLDKTPLGYSVKIHAVHDTHNIVIYAYLYKYAHLNKTRVPNLPDNQYKRCKDRSRNEGNTTTESLGSAS